MKNIIKKFLHKKGLYYPLKYSKFFDLYRHLFKNQTVKNEKREIAFYQSFLHHSDLIFDIGANDGHKTEAFLHLSEKVICCEPDKENFIILKSRFRAKKKRVVLVNKALSSSEGSATLHVHHPGSAFNTLSSKWKGILEEQGPDKWNEDIQFAGIETVTTTTLDQLIEEYGRPTFIKIDVEGFEEMVLRGLTQPVPCLSFETLLPDYRNELDTCLKLIAGLDDHAIFNISVNEKLRFDTFVPIDALRDWLEQYTEGKSFEVIVKMNNENRHF